MKAPELIGAGTRSDSTSEIKSAELDVKSIKSSSKISKLSKEQQIAEKVIDFELKQDFSFSPFEYIRKLR